MAIADNEDVASWVCQSLSIQPNKIPLYITLKQSLSRSVSGSNQDMINRPNRSQYVDVVSTIFSTEVEDQHPIALSSPHEPLVVNSALENGDNVSYKNREEDEFPHSNQDNKDQMDNVEIGSDQHETVKLYSIIVLIQQKKAYTRL